MEVYQNLRHWLYRFRRKHARKARKSGTFLSGLPQGLEHECLSAVLQEQFGETVASVSHLHLSGWKSSGAFRLWIKTSAGNEKFIIYKNAVYERSEIPALVDFPLVPGPPEYCVLSQARDALAAYLPLVYLAEEVVPGKYYRYLLEDLRQHYRPIAGDTDKKLVARQLPNLHQALSEWLERSNPSGFLHYGRGFSAELHTYARAKLEQYQQHANLPVVREIIREWPDIARLHLEPSFFNQPPQLIHGDSNYTNFHISKRDPQQLKVVDWEWAGFASPYADLASLNKGSLSSFEEQSFQEFCEARGECQPGEQSFANREAYWQQYQWGMLERSLMDAAFLSAQYLDASNQAKFHMPDAIAVSLRRVLDAYHQLSK